MDGAVERLHATAVAVGKRAVLIRGASGSGKSDLALRCLALPATELWPVRARLVADDQVIVTRVGAGLIAKPPSELAGKLEIRGLGIVEVSCESDAKVVLIADLVDGRDVERYPDPWPRAAILGLSVPILRIWAFESAAAEKVLAALSMAALPPVRECG